MHDHGPLPLPREGGPYALLIGCTNQAKKDSDIMLTKLIAREKEAKTSADGLQVSPAATKRIRNL